MGHAQPTSGKLPMRCRKWAWLGYGLGTFAMAWGVVWAVATWRFEATLGQARRAMTSGDYRSAATRLAWLSARRPGRAGVGRSSSAEAVAMVRAHVTVDLFPLPVEHLKEVLSQASAKDPEDDRVWLAQANLATRTGRFDEAEQWLDACLRRRPEDPAVWQ